MNTTKEERTILAFKLQSKMNPDQGDIRPVAEVLDNQLLELNSSNFCHTNKVFVTKDYQFIDEKFKEGQLFRINVNEADYISPNIDLYAASKYLTQGIKAERLKPSELFEIVEGELPDRNCRYFENGYYPGTEYIFIRNKEDNCCYGPFSWEHKEDDLGVYLELLNDKPLLKSYKMSIGQIFKINPESFNTYAFDCPIENRSYYFILNLHEFINDYEYYDYASDEEIVRYCAKLAGEMGTKSLNKSDWDSFKRLANVHSKFDQPLSKSRLAKLSDLTLDVFNIQDEIRDNLEVFLRSNSGDQLIKDFIENKRSHLLKSLREEIIAEKNKEIIEKEEKISQIEQRFKEKDKELKELSAEVERKRNEAKHEVILEQAIAERDEKIQQLDKKISAKEAQLNEITERFNLSSELGEIHEEIKKQQHIREFMKEENDSLKKTKEQLEEECKANEDKLRKKLTLLKPYVETINGSFVFDSRENRNIFVKVHDIAPADNFAQQQWVIETVKYNLRLKGRYFESWQIANLLISTQQSFITFLAGLPGVGKTSLARLMAEAQHLEPRLQEVSVARGWTTQKDLIGFYNPLSNRFQSSNTGLYAFIEALSLEAKKEEQAMAYILLDEANLSPIEHYWSAFMAMADNEGKRDLRLGQEVLEVSTALRFLATINYDGTTEPLSPRVVDRAPVLVMESSDTVLEENDPLLEKKIDLPLSAMEMNKLFGLAQKTPAFEDEEAIIFNKIRKTLSDPNLEKGRPLSISQRKEIVIRQYCAQASSLMRSLGCDDLKALDLAILQHVLPQVRGNGQKFSNRLKELKQICDNEGLKDSAHYLDRMLAYGETELHSYDFFCW